jgi:hypothetical protein
MLGQVTTGRTTSMKTHRALFGLMLTGACGALLVLGAVAAPSGAQAAGTPAAVHAATPSRASSALDAFARAWSGVTDTLRR